MAEMVAAAVLAASAPDTPSSQRADANALIMQVQDSPDAVDIATELVAHPEFDVRFFALQLLDTTVTYSWTALSPDQQAMLKQMAVALISGDMMGYGGSDVLMKKGVAVAAQIAVYEWPHNWPDLTETLYGLATGGGGGEQIQIVVLAFESLGESIGLVSGLNAKLDRITHARARQLSRSYGAEVPTLYEFGASVLGDHLEKALGGDEGAVGVVRAGFGLFRVLFEYFSVEPLTPDIVNYLVGGLCSPFRHEALRALQGLLTQNHTSGASTVLGLFDELGGLFGALEASNGAITDATLAHEHAFQTQLIDVLASLGLFALRIARRGRDDPRALLPPAFGIYVQNCIELALSHPSLRVQTTLLPLWVSFLRDPLLDADAQAEVLKSLLELANNLVTMANPVMAQPPASTLATLDFDSAEEVKKELRRVHRRGQALLQSITRLDGPLAVSYATQFVHYVFADVLPASGHADGAHCANNSEAWLALNGSALMLSASLSALSGHLLRPLAATTGEAMNAEDEAHEAEAREMVVAAVGALLADVIDFTTPSPYLAGRFVSLLEAFTPFLAVHTDGVGPVFATILTFLTYRQPSEADCDLDALSGATLNLRDRALHGVITLAIDAGAALLDSLEELWTFATGAVDAGQVRRAEAVGLYRAIVYVLSKSTDADVQAGVIASILEPILAEWTSDAVTTLVSSGTELVVGLGLDGSLLAEDGDIVAVFGRRGVEARERVFYLLSVLSAVAKHSANWQAPVLAPHFATILEPLLALVSSLNEFYTADVAEAMVPPDSVFAGLLGAQTEWPDDESLEPLLGIRSVRKDPDVQVDVMRWWLINTHTTALSLLAFLMRSTELFSIDGIGDALLNSVFSNLDSVPLPVLRIIISDVMTTLRRKAPDDLKPAILFPVLRPFVEFVQARLASAWDARATRAAAAAAGDSPPDAMDAQTEIQLDNMLQKTTISFASFLRSLSFRLSTVTTSDIITPLEAQFIASELATEFASATLSLLTWPAPQSMMIGVLLCERMVPIFSADDSFCSFLANSMLPAVLAAATLIEEESHIRRIVDCVHLMYVTLADKMDDISPLRAVILDLPGVTDDDLSSLERAISSGNLSLRARSSMWRALLSQVVSSSVTSALHRKDTFLIDTLA